MGKRLQERLDNEISQIKRFITHLKKKDDQEERVIYLKGLLTGLRIAKENDNKGEVTLFVRTKLKLQMGNKLWRG